MVDNPADARYALLSGLIDDASLYPPAQLGLAEAVAAHLVHHDGEHAWLAGRFVVPASRLAELDDLLPPGRMLELSVVLDGAAAADFAEGVRADLASVLAAERPDRLVACSVEVRLPPDGAPAVAALADGLMEHGLAGRIDAYAEIDVAGRPPAELAAVVGALAATQRRLTDRARGLVAAVVGRVRGRRAPDGTADAGHLLAAKVRCGGEAVPSAEELGGFLLACGRAGVTYKATAGLHHPHPRLDADSGEILEHGLLSVAAAGALVTEAAARAPRSGSGDLGGGAARARYAPTPGPGARSAAPPEQDTPVGLAALVAVLSDPGPLLLSAEGLAAAGRVLDGELLERYRRSGLLAVGSCAIDETVTDLVALGVLAGEGRLA